MKVFKLLILIFCTLLFLPYSNSMAYEEANYEVIKKNKIYEIRKYSDRLAVETIEYNQNSGFRKLFNYISGNNKTNQEIFDLFNELIQDHRDQHNLKKIESLEQKLINNLDESSYSELIKLKSQLNRD